MKPKDQADETAVFILTELGNDAEGHEFAMRCTDRIESDGALQYYNAETDKMKFETMSAEDLLEYLEEELLDAANYLFMIEERGGPFLDGFLRNIFHLWRAVEDARGDIEAEVVTTEFEEGFQ